MTPATSSAPSTKSAPSKTASGAKETATTLHPSHSNCDCAFGRDHWSARLFQGHPDHGFYGHGQSGHVRAAPDRGNDYDRLTVGVATHPGYDWQRNRDKRCHRQHGPFRDSG